MPESTPPQPLERVTIVLVEPQNPDNIGGVVRAMMNMGLARLRLVRPKRYDPERVGSAAHRSRHFQETIEFFDDLPSALVDANLVVAASARRRRLGPRIMTPKALAPTILAHARTGAPAILFGREDWGLPNEVVQHCHYQIAIPAAPEYQSLNLAQAVLLIAYELRQAAVNENAILPPAINPKDPPATEAEFKAAVASILAALDKAGFFKPGQEPAKRMKVERLLRRTQPTASEAGLLRAMGYVFNRTIRKEK